MTFGEKLKAARNISGLSQEQFAEALNISRSAVAKWENNIGIPDVSNLNGISKLLNISIDSLLDENDDLENKDISLGIALDDNQMQGESILPCPEYEGYNCTIELNGWNDGVYDVIIIGQDNNFLYYQKQEKNKLVTGMIGKNYIVSVAKTKEIKTKSETKDISKLYFIDKHVILEVAHNEGILKGFFDYTNDDYLDVVIKKFNEKDLELMFGHTIDINKITKIEEL